MAIAGWNPSGQALTPRAAMDRLFAASSIRPTSALSSPASPRPGSSALDLRAEDQPETQGGAATSTETDEADVGETGTQGTQGGEGVTTKTGSTE